VGIINLFIYHNNIIFFGPGRAGLEDKIDGLDRAENLRPLQVYSRYIVGTFWALLLNVGTYNYKVYKISKANRIKK